MNSDIEILIVSAMVSEIEYIIEKLQNKIESQTPICIFYEGVLSDRKVVVCKINVGTIRAAAAITLAIEKYKPQYIINAGCAGAYGKDIHKGDIVIGTRCINITSFETSQKCTGEGYDFNSWKLKSFIEGQDNELIVENGSDSLINKIKENNSLYNYGKIHYGTIGSGDIWTKEADRISEISEKYGVLCEEMEGISIYTISNLYKIPAVDVRIISNNEILNEKYDTCVLKKLQEYVLKLIEKI